MLCRLAFLIALLLPAAAFAQGAVLQVGGVFQGHNAMWVANGYIADAGGPSANGQSPTNPPNGLLPLGYASVNKGLGTCQFSNYAATTYSSLCTGFDGNGNGLITLRNSSGSSPSFTIEIGGVSYPFPGPGTGNAVAPTSPFMTAGDAVCANGGTTLKDCGGPPVNASLFAQGQILSGLGSGSYHARYLDTGVSIMDYPTVGDPNVCSGSDDTGPLLAALATNKNVMLPAGTCTFNTQVNGVVANLTQPGQCIIGSGKGITIVSTNITTGAVFELTGDDACVVGIAVNAPAMTDGFLILDNNDTDALVADIDIQDIAGLVAVLPASGEIVIDNIRGTGVHGGSANIYDTAIGAGERAFVLGFGTNGNAGPILGSRWILGADNGNVFAGSISGATLTVTSILSPSGVGQLGAGQYIFGSGRAVAANTKILSQNSGTTGGVGTYTVSVSQTVGGTEMAANPVAAVDLDGSSNSSGWSEIRLNNFDTCLLMTNRIGATGGNVPNFVNGIDYECQTPSATLQDGAGFDIQQGTQIAFHHLFLNKVGMIGGGNTTGDGIFCGVNCADLQIFGPRANGMSGNGIDIFGTQVGIFGGSFSSAGNSGTTCSGCANIKVENGASVVRVMSLTKMGGANTAFDLNVGASASDVKADNDAWAATTPISDPGNNVTVSPAFQGCTLGNTGFNCFTPTLTYATPGSVTFACTTNYGQWWRHGALVEFEVRLVGCNGNSGSGESGNLIVTGIPLTSMGGVSGLGHLTVGRYSKITLDASYTQVSAEMVNGSPQVFFFENGSGQASQNLTATNVAPNATNVEIDVGGTYLTNTN